MAKITQYSRISHHTIAGSASAGLTFSVPAQEDFTDGSWTPYDLALSEIGVNEQDERVFIRIDDIIKEFAFIGASGVGFTGGSGSCISDFYTQNIFACDGQLINLQAADTIETFVDNTSDGTQFLISAGYSTVLLRANNNPQTYTNQVSLGSSIGSAVEISSTDTSTNESGQINVLSDNIKLRIQDIGVLDATEISLSLTSSYWEQADGTNYRNAIDFNTTDMLFKAEDISNIKYGELQLTHTVTYFSHYNNGLLSYIQAQDNTIDIQTQGGGALNQISMDTPNSIITVGSTDGFTVSSLTTRPTRVVMTSADISTTLTNTITAETSKITLISEDTSLITQPSKVEINPTQIDIFAPSNCTIGGSTNKISIGNQQIIFEDFAGGVVYDGLLTNGEPNVYKQGEINTTNNTPTLLSSIGFGITNSVITIEAVVNGWGATNSKAYGAKLFGTFKNAGGTVTQLSTTDKSEKTDFSTATSDFNISGTDINVRVTGEASTDINWVSRFNYQISK